MLNPLTFTVQAESGPLEVTANGLDYAAYEDAYDKAALPAIALPIVLHGVSATPLMAA